jgi:hypothetical protein
MSKKTTPLTSGLVAVKGQAAPPSAAGSAVRTPALAKGAKKGRPSAVERTAKRASGEAPSGRADRIGKQGLLGYFSREMCKDLRIMAAQEDTTLQSLMGEAFDLLFQDRGKKPYGER